MARGFEPWRNQIYERCNVVSRWLGLFTKTVIVEYALTFKKNRSYCSSILIDIII